MKLIITLISFLFTTTVLFGQIVDKTEQKAINKTNQRIDTKIDRGLDKGLDAVEGLFKKKKTNDKQSDKDNNSDQSQNSASSSDTQSAMSMFGGKAKVEDSYDFDHNLLLNVDTYDKKGKQQDPMDMRMYFSDDKPNFGMQIEMEGSKNFIIFDMKSYQIVSLIENDGQKMGIAMKLDPEKVEERLDESSNDGDEKVVYKFVKTGNSKVISGYNCDEYAMESSEADPEWDQSFWVTDEVDANWLENMSKMAASNKQLSKKFEIPEGYPEGTIIQIVSESTKNQEKSIMTVKEYNKNQEKSFSTAGYQFMTMPSMGGN